MRRKEVVYVCDNPKCRARSMTDDPTNPKALAYGWHFDNISLVTAAGGGGVKGVYACSDECVVEAVRARMFGED